MAEPDLEASARLVRDFIDAAWTGGDLGVLDRFWTPDCVNHAAPPGHDVGLDALHAYHAEFAAWLTAFSDVVIDVVQQVAQDDRVVTHLSTRATHTGDVLGVPATGRTVTLASIRIDRLEAGRIAEHWSVADVAGLVQQLQG